MSGTHVRGLGERAQRLATAFTEAGWTRRSSHRSGHLVWRCPRGCCQVTMGTTPGDPRGDRNTLASIRRCAAGHGMGPSRGAAA